MRYPIHPLPPKRHVVGRSGKYTRNLRGAFLFREFGTECPENQIRPSLGGGGTSAVATIRGKPNAEPLEENGEPRSVRKTETRVFFFLSAVRTGTSRDSSIRPSGDRALIQAVSRMSLTEGAQVRIPGQFVCGMRWTKWHWCSFPCQYHSTDAPCYLHLTVTINTRW